MASIRNIYMNNIYIYLKLDEDIWKTSWKLNTHIYIYYIMGVAIYIYTHLVNVYIANWKIKISIVG